MSTPSIETLQRQLADALNRIGQLERKVEAMRQNTNANLDWNAKVLAGITEHVGIRERYSFKMGTDVAQGHL